ncbi:MAG: DUF3667 domain-containing protein [Ferruginibacter sp.]|nr:DUF3667 domain-containing protein [Ferruginibacter sp.]MBU9936091.1 DUF3667 domain-containing protein [Ferruginibacter sp.]
MSRLKERQQKNCLNCNTDVQGRYCHVCGQENIEPKESVWELISHFFRDITHFDGKFFSTVKWLLVRPGFLSKEYMQGRRASYVNPVRMYIFTSAFFFLIFFTFFKSDKIDVQNGTTVNKKTLSDIAKMDSAFFADFTRNINREDGKPDKPMTREEFRAYVDTMLVSSNANLINVSYKTRRQYDSVLKAGKGDGWLARTFTYKLIDLNNKYNGRKLDAFRDFKELLLHSLPQLLFLSLPLLAMILKLVYIRRKEFYYVSHGIFSLHLYIFIFIALLLIFCLDSLNGMLGWRAISWLIFFLYLGMFFYEYKAMRNFYMQRRAKTMIKFILVNILFLIVLCLLFTTFVLFSFFKL